MQQLRENNIAAQRWELIGSAYATKNAGFLRRTEVRETAPEVSQSVSGLRVGLFTDVREGLIALAHRVRCSEVGRVIVPPLAVFSDQPALGTR